MSFKDLFDDEKFLCRGMLIVLITGIIIRLVLGYLFDYNNDVTAWTMTIANIDSGTGLYGVAGFYYPPVWGYMLGLFGEIIEHLGVDSLGDFFTDLIFMMELYEEPSTSTPTFNFAISMFLFIGDFLCALTVYWIIDQLTQDKKKAKIGFALYFLGINVFVISMMGAMFDSFSALMILLSVCLLIKGKDMMAGGMFTFAVMTKAFPVFLIFLLVAYLIKKDREHCVKRITFAAVGAIVALVILLIPEMMTGTVMDVFSFVLSRADGSSALGLLDKLLSYGIMIVYPAIIIFEIILAAYFVKHNTENVEQSLLLFMLLATAIIFINPGTPQYLIMLMPFTIISFLLFDNRLKIPLIMLMIGSSMAHLTHFSSDMVAIVMYDGLISFDTWKTLYDINLGPDHITHIIIENVGLITQYIATLLAGYYALDTIGIISKLKKKLDSEEKPEETDKTI